MEKIINWGRKIIRTFTKKSRISPSFLIPGVMKGGTSSLFKYIRTHPNVKKPYLKELRFFTEEYTSNLEEYRKYFPLKITKYYYESFLRRSLVSCEATPDYFFHPLAPERIYEALPNVKFVILLRNPVERAISHYYHLKRYKDFNGSFEDELNYEINNLSWTKEHYLNNSDVYPVDFDRYSILARGRYIDILKMWRTYFDSDQMMVIKSEDFYEYTEHYYLKILEFLRLPVPNKLPEFKIHNQNNYSSDSKLKSWLESYYRPYNKQLNEFLGQEFQWN